MNCIVKWELDTLCINFLREKGIMLETISAHNFAMEYFPGQNILKILHQVQNFSSQITTMERTLGVKVVF